MPPSLKSSTPDQIDAILERIRDDGDMLMFCAAIFSTHTGMRMSQIAALRWCDVHFDSKLISVPTGQSNQTLLVPLPKDLVACLQQLHDSEGGEELIFKCPPDRLALRVNRALCLACKKLRLETIRAVNLRPCFVKRISRYCVPAHVLAQVRAYCRMLANYKKN